MPSRKKAKGQARKAAKEQAAIEAAKKEREDRIKLIEQSQLQRLQISNTADASLVCMHGYVPFPKGDSCIDFINAFVHEVAVGAMVEGLDVRGRSIFERAENATLGEMLASWVWLHHTSCSMGPNTF